MARAAGIQAYAARPRPLAELFIPHLTLSQLDDAIAIVNVDGKDQFFDPGARYCPYGHLAWKHSSLTGIRQKDSGSDFVRLQESLQQHRLACRQPHDGRDRRTLRHHQDDLHRRPRPALAAPLTARRRREPRARDSHQCSRTRSLRSRSQSRLRRKTSKTTSSLSLPTYK